MSVDNAATLVTSLLQTAGGLESLKMQALVGEGAHKRLRKAAKHIRKACAQIFDEQLCPAPASKKVEPDWKPWNAEDSFKRQLRKPLRDISTEY